MSKVEAIEQQIRGLSHAEFTEIREWILERDWDRWDVQIEQDVAAGKLDKLIAESQEDYQSGRSREL